MKSCFSPAWLSWVELAPIGNSSGTLACSRYFAVTTVVGVPRPVMSSTWSRSTSLRVAANARDGS